MNTPDTRATHRKNAIFGLFIEAQILAAIEKVKIGRCSSSADHGVEKVGCRQSRDVKALVAVHLRVV